MPSAEPLRAQITSPPILSTPESHIFEDPTSPIIPINQRKLSEKEIFEIYEVERTAREISAKSYKRVALQFPDGMLGDASAVVATLEGELRLLDDGNIQSTEGTGAEVFEQKLETDMHAVERIRSNGGAIGKRREAGERIRLYILADTSYGSCCVDEIAAEHVNADVVIHYGRSCLSPTARLPVIYVFTSQPLDISAVVEAYENTFPEKEEKVVLAADIIFHSHIPRLEQALREKGYRNLLAPGLIHDPESAIPNRRVGEGVQLNEYSLFHISDPPTALLLTLSSRVKEMFIYSTSTTSKSSSPTALRANTAPLLRRRYALLTSLSTCPIYGILINTLSVANYLTTASNISSLISRSGKKSYTFVVGKVNAAKIANFSEVGGWVVVGCWESSLVDSVGAGLEFYRPLITPFELRLALQNDEERVWDGSWTGGFGDLSLGPGENARDSSGSTIVPGVSIKEAGGNLSTGGPEVSFETGDESSEEESAPPEFDLRTGRYVSHSRPMRAVAATTTTSSTTSPAAEASRVLIRRARLDLAAVNGTVSPGAEYLRTQRTWTGLGSDFADVEGHEGIEEGRSGVAKGYVVGDDGGERR